MLRNQQSGFNQALWLGISQASSFVLAFISAAILSRYFDKTEYGTYKQIIYVYTTLQTVFTAGLPGVFSYFLPRYSEAEGKTLVNKITRVFFVLGLLFSVVFPAYHSYHGNRGDLYGLEENSIYCYLPCY